mmetsp:Transcript_31744/g.101336  ORF Transcript_31744/g.101336 Transcript_31744/m.101336 type:complete len:192 (-) Transcript_31744:116-691(-)
MTRECKQEIKRITGVSSRPQRAHGYTLLSPPLLSSSPMRQSHHAQVAPMLRSRHERKGGGRCRGIRALHLLLLLLISHGLTYGNVLPLVFHTALSDAAACISSSGSDSCCCFLDSRQIVLESPPYTGIRQSVSWTVTNGSITPLCSLLIELSPCPVTASPTIVASGGTRDRIPSSSSESSSMLCCSSAASS